MAAAVYHRVSSHFSSHAYFVTSPYLMQSSGRWSGVYFWEALRTERVSLMKFFRLKQVAMHWRLNTASKIIKLSFFKVHCSLGKYKPQHKVMLKFVSARIACVNRIQEQHKWSPGLIHYLHISSPNGLGRSNILAST